MRWNVELRYVLRTPRTCAARLAAWSGKPGTTSHLQCLLVLLCLPLQSAATDSRSRRSFLIRALGEVAQVGTAAVGLTGLEQRQPTWR